MLNYQILSEADMIAFGATLAKAMTDHVIIFLHGPLGAGKTTLVRGLLRGLGYQGKVKSPTYTLVESYEVADKKIFHFDFYRLENPQELEHMGIRDYFSTPAICLIEWPDKGKGFLPVPDIECYIRVTDTIRNIYINVNSAGGTEIIKKIMKG